MPKPGLSALRRFLRNIARAMRLVWAAAPGLTAASAALVVAQSALPLAGLWLVKLIVDAITAAAAAPVGSAYAASALQTMFMLIGIACGVALLSVAFNAIAAIVSEAHALRVADHMQDVLHGKSIEVDLAYYENSKYYDTLHRAQMEAPFRPARIAKGLVAAGQNALSLAAMAGLLLSLHWSIALVLLIAIVPEGLVHLKFANANYDMRRRRTSTERHAYYYSWILTNSEYAQELRLFDLGGNFARRHRDIRKRLREETLVLVQRRSVRELAAQAVATLAVYGAYAFIAVRTVQGGITLGDLVMYFQAFQRGQDYLRQLLRGLAALYEDSLFLGNFYEFLDLERKVVEPARPRPMPRPMHRGIRFENVSFSYGAKSVLTDVNLEIPAGATVALVGENGSGKTTLVKLLARLYDPAAGRITIDGIDLRDFTTTALRREVSVIFQNYVRYHLTARENIGFGSIESSADPERLASAVRFAGASELVRRLPRGLDTMLGKWFEDGEELSVGEWQKIALARMLLRDAQVLVLDEPTSAMDAAAEYEMFKRFRDMAAGRTAILISHRLSTVRMADRIYVVGGGRILESGTHDELLRGSGAYAELFTVQASGYR
jgi:ATP-binding cassette subfamily B protein